MEVKLPALLGNYDMTYQPSNQNPPINQPTNRSTYRSTNRPGHREVSLPNYSDIDSYEKKTNQKVIHKYNMHFVT